MAKRRIKKSVKAKGALALLLVVILTALCTGFAVTQKHKIAKEAETSVPTEAESESATTEPTEAPTEGTTVPTTTEPTTTEPTTTEPTTTEPTTAKAPPVSLPAASADNPVIVSPTGDKWELTVVNLSYCLPEGYEPKLAAAVEGSSVQLDERVAPQYAAMYAAAKADGCTLTPYSGYRSYARQKNNFDRKVDYYKKQGFSEADAIVKTRERILPAGHSEHNMGFAMDVVSASADFVSTKEYSWLVAHAHEYGFILRYPENKTQITGVMYEPWHWRYVGEKAAKEMQQSGQCLEEYLGLA